MRIHHLAAALFSLSCALCVASCVQGDPAEEPTGETAQPSYESVFHFVVDVKDDGRGAAGGWQKATATLKFSDWRQTIPYFWRCPIVVGMPIRTQAHGRIPPQYASKITAEVASEVTETVMHSRDSWQGQGVVYCKELREQMQKMLRGPAYGIGATVSML